MQYGLFINALIANATAIIGFIPIGILSSKLGRKSDYFGIILLVLCFSFVHFKSKN